MLKQKIELQEINQETSENRIGFKFFYQGVTSRFENL